MSKSLPTAPSMEHLKKQAKDLRKSHKNRNSECCETLRLLHQYMDLPNEELFSAKLSLNEIQLALALDYGFKSWSDLKRHVLGKTDNLEFLHIHCGDASAQPLRNSSVPGDILIWREIYVEGPVPGQVEYGEFCRIRAEFLSRSVGIRATREEILEGSRARNKALAEAGKYAEVVLWFDSCMFDQTIMIHVIDQCVKHNWPETKLSLVCIDYDWNVKAAEDLLETRHQVTMEEIDLAHRAWNAYTSCNPRDIETLLGADCSALPFLSDALSRHLEQFPAVHNGLSRTENQVLKAVANGSTKLIEVFSAVQRMESRPFMGDTSLWSCMDALADATVPLLKLDGPGRIMEQLAFDPEAYEVPPVKTLKQWAVSMTEAGKAVLQGGRDHIRLNGIDRWFGGVHLQGAEARWRWNTQSRMLIELTVTTESFVNSRQDARRVPVIIKDTAPANILYIEYEGADAESTGRAIQTIADFIDNNDLTKVSAYTCIYPPEGAEGEHMVVQVAIAEIVDRPMVRINFKQAGALKVASIYWKRSSGDIKRSIELLLQAVEEKNLRCDRSESFRQVYHNDPVQSNEPLAELQIRLV